MGWRYLDLADFLLIAEAVLDIPAEDLLRADRIELAESALHALAAEFGGVEFLPELARWTPPWWWTTVGHRRSSPDP